MKTTIFLPDFEIHTTPLESISMNAGPFIIDLDDINEKRHRIKISPYQAIRITTIDCDLGDDYYNDYCFRDGIYHRHIIQIIDSPLIDQLKSNLKKIDPAATFLNNAKHYVLPLQDIIIDIVATKINVCPLELIRK